MERIAFITGSSRGIGRAIALRLATEGYRIVLHGSTDSKELRATEKALKKLGASPFVTYFDVSNKAEVDAACELLLKNVGGIDVLVNNAGIIRDRSFSKMSEEEWDDVIKTNLYGPFYITKQLLPKMKMNKYGRIINVSSIVALKGNFGQTNYAAAKAGLIGMTKSLAKEVAKYNITVNVVTPGLIQTEKLNDIPEDHKNLLLAQISLGRIGKPEEVADVVSFLASDKSLYVTGAVIDVNGGWL